MMATKNIKRTQDIRIPTAITSAQAEANLLRMSSHIRGYLATGESDFRNRYQQARQEFEAELVNMRKLLQVHASPGDQQHLQELQFLKNEGETPISLILAEINTMIDQQGKRAPSSNNTLLLKDMANFQSSFALLVSSLRGYLLTQESSFRFEYTAKFKANQQAWEKLQNQYILLTD